MKSLLRYALPLVWTLVIWSRSLYPAEQSSAQSLEVLAWLTPLLEFLGQEPEVWHTLVRKLAHMTEFTVLGALWSVVPGVGLSGKLLCCLLTALADETIQLFVPGRSGQVSDVWIDFTGAVLGTALGYLLCLLLRRRRKCAEKEEIRRDA